MMKISFNNLPIRLKLVIPLITVVAALLISMNIYFPRLYKQNLAQAYAQEAARTAELFSVAASAALELHSFELLQQTLHNAKRHASILYIFLFEKNGEPLATYSPRSTPVPNPPVSDKTSITTKPEAIVVRQQIVGCEQNVLGHLVLGYSLESLNQKVKKVRAVTILLAGVSFLLGLFFLNSVSKRITRSVQQLHTQMQETIKTGCYTSKVPVSTHDEIGQLAEVFNQMIAELMRRQQSTIESQQRYRDLYEKIRKLNRLKTMFVSDASHHLRTPLTIIRGEVEVSLQKERSPAEYNETLMIVEEEARHLGKIVENLLTLAKADTGNLVALQDAIDFSHVCETQIRHASVLIQDKGLHLSCQIEKNCFVRGDPNRLSEVVFNLLDNAAKYTPEDQSITLKLESRENSALLTVTDTGPGIPEQDLDRIFDRFYRGENSRSRSKGSGLGLAICKSIITAHGGKIRAASIPGQGSTFKVELRRARIDDEIPLTTETEDAPHRRTGVT
ncbi:MAG: ATP-binding protein [bacterium]